jgi:hypothetical protein
MSKKQSSRRIRTLETVALELIHQFEKEGKHERTFTIPIVSQLSSKHYSITIREETER